MTFLISDILKLLLVLFMVYIYILNQNEEEEFLEQCGDSMFPPNPCVPVQVLCGLIQLGPVWAGACSGTTNNKLGKLTNNSSKT